MFKEFDLELRWHARLYELEESDRAIPAFSPQVVPVVPSDEAWDAFWNKPRPKAKAKAAPEAHPMPAIEDVDLAGDGADEGDADEGGAEVGEGGGAVAREEGLGEEDAYWEAVLLEAADLFGDAADEAPAVLEEPPLPPPPLPPSEPPSPAASVGEGAGAPPLGDEGGGTERLCRSRAWGADLLVQEGHVRGQVRQQGPWQMRPDEKQLRRLEA